MSRQLPRVLIVFNEPVLAKDHPDYASEVDILETVVEVEKVLPDSHYVVAKFGYARDPSLFLREIDRFKPDAIFNLFEGEADRTETEILHAAVTEWTNVPFTGSPSTAIALGRDKIRTKYILQGAGIPTAGFCTIDSLPAPAWPHSWPAIVKPAYQDASVGIDQASVVSSQKELEQRAEWIFSTLGGPAIVEQFLLGREFHVNLFEESINRPGENRLRVVPPTELVFEAGPGIWPIYSYEGKWNESSEEYKKTRLDTGATLPSPLLEQVAEVCTTTYRLMGMRDYGRVDLRVTPDGRPHVLEVNPNPYLNSIGLIDGLKALGYGFPEFIQGLVRRALARKAK